ncbi:hypothetical protein TNCT_170981 [Trichonephila clavata]|uniref:Uncharacterized protein n=1 Tax=Trichonephila clavata TaxID=2740835 RepID=A0A8X6H716_TRICU|nr:hypothetical protein TNCT_170981 [Trichonephila clavata]
MRYLFLQMIAGQVPQEAYLPYKKNFEPIASILNSKDEIKTLFSSIVSSHPMRCFLCVLSFTSIVSAENHINHRNNQFVPVEEDPKISHTPTILTVLFCSLTLIMLQDTVISSVVEALAIRCLLTVKF